MSNIRLLSVLLVTFCLLLLASCHGSPTNTKETTEAVTTEGSTVATPSPVKAEELFSYRIVIADLAEDAVKETAEYLRRGIQTFSGSSSVELITDFEYQAGALDTTRVDREILLGRTNRDETAVLASLALGRLDYVIDHATTRVAILGGSDAVLYHAVSYFLSEFCRTGAEIPSGFRHVHRFNKTDYTVEGTPLLQFSLITEQGVSHAVETQLTDALRESFDLSLSKAVSRDDASASLILTLNERLSGQYRITVDDKAVQLVAGSHVGLQEAVRVFLSLLAEKTALTAADSVTGTVELPLSSYTDAAVIGQLFVEGLTHKDALSYAVGEEILFRFRLSDSGDTTRQYACPLFTYIAKTDDGRMLSGQFCGESGEITLRFTMDRPGYVQVFVKACDENGQALSSVVGFNGAACAGFDDIKTVKEEPDDFWAFWQEQLSALDGVTPTLLSKTEMKGKHGEFYCYDIRIQTNDTPVSAWLTYPKDAAPGSLKIKMLFQGYGQNDPVLEFNHGYITVSVNSHSVDNGRDDAYYGQTVPQNFGFSTADYTDPSKAYFRNMILRDVQAFRFAKSLPEWDGKTAVIAGMSMGAFQSTAVAALEPGCTHLNLHITWLCDIGGRTAGRIAGWLPEYTDGLRYYDTAYFATGVTAITTVTAGLADPVSVPCGVTACYNAIRGEKTITFLQKATHSTAPSVLTKEYKRSAPAAS